MDTSSIPGLELIQVADVVAREKSIEREEVMHNVIFANSPLNRSKCSIRVKGLSMPGELTSRT